MLRVAIIPLLVIGLALSACRRRSSPPAPAAPAADVAPPAAPATPAAPASEPTAGAAPAPGPGTRVAYATQTDIDAYNKALAEYCYRVSDIPTDLNDLKNRRGLPPLPVPPPGRRLAYRPDLKLMEMKSAVIRLE